MMADIRGTYKIDRSRLIEHRLKARLLIGGVFLGIYMLFLVLSMFKKDSLASMTITNYIFLSVLGVFTLTCLFFTTRAERTVIVVSDKAFMRIIDGETTATISFNDIGKLMDFSSGFLIVKKGIVVGSDFFRRSHFEHYDSPDVIYVPQIIHGYLEIHDFVESVLKKGKI